MGLLEQPSAGQIAHNPGAIVDTAAFSGTDSHNLLNRCRDSGAVVGFTTT
jgi:hypothetical protein